MAQYKDLHMSSLAQDRTMGFATCQRQFLLSNKLSRRLSELFSKMAVFWVVAPCSLVEVYQRFRGPSCLHHQGDRPDQTTRRYNPEDSHLLTQSRENLKSYSELFSFVTV
jgi:hypothetical protein